MKNLRIRPPKIDKPAGQEATGQKKRIMDPDRKPCTYCKDFRLGYWIVWNGYMRFCSFMNGPDIPVRDKSFQECWQELVKFQESLQWPEECRICEQKESCARCAALFDIENGNLKMKDEFCKKRFKRSDRNGRI